MKWRQRGRESVSTCATRPAGRGAGQARLPRSGQPKGMTACCHCAVSNARRALLSCGYRARGGIRTLDLPITSRFTAVHRVAASVILAGQVDYPVRLVAFRLAGRAGGMTVRMTAALPRSRDPVAAHPSGRCLAGLVVAAPVGEVVRRAWVLTGGGTPDSMTRAMTSVSPTQLGRRPDRQRTWPRPAAPNLQPAPAEVGREHR